MVPNRWHLTVWAVVIWGGAGASLWWHDPRPATTALVGFLAVVAVASVRDVWTAWSFGSPECPGPPDSATRRQRIVWRVLHSIDPILPPLPEQIDMPHPRRPPDRIDPPDRP